MLVAVEPVDTPSGLSPEAARDWTALASDGEPDGVFTADRVAALPEPVRRWLTHAIDEGTPVARAVELRTSGCAPPARSSSAGGRRSPASSGSPCRAGSCGRRPRG